MNIKLDSTVSKVKFNGNEVDKVKYNGSVIWSKPVAQHVYGVSWSGTNTASQVLTRTDDAANFSNPVPYINDGVMTGADCSSPFDNCYPWNGMVKETIDGNSMVKIPKFWYTFTYSGSGDTAHLTSLKIADYPASGYYVSPAHMDHGYGEQDYVYISRYAMTDSSNGYKSITGAAPWNNQMKSTYRTTAATSLGDGYHVIDYYMMLTLYILYLVEFANTDIRNCIGNGGVSSGDYSNNGTTDSMPYHTGTTGQTVTATSSIQYRNIEGLWSNIGYFIDGIVVQYNSSTGYRYLQLNTDIANYSYAPGAGSAVYRTMTNRQGTSSSGKIIYNLQPAAINTSYIDWCFTPTTGGTTSYNWIQCYLYYYTTNTPQYSDLFVNTKVVQRGLFSSSQLNNFDTGKRADIGCKFQYFPSHVHT